MNCNGGPNAIGEQNSNETFMDCTPIVTYAGDKELFQSLSSDLTKAIITESAEWRRSYDRPVKQVKLKASFAPYTSDIVPAEKDFNLIKYPILHTYWSECSDVDVYKATLREDIDSWLKSLTRLKVQDWMIILVENFDFKKGNKLLPRTTVLDKVRSDFASKHGDRCLSIINPHKSESKSAESWRGMVNRIRVLMLIAYDRTLLRFEEIIRENRERRNNPNWNYCQYFQLQEELAFVLEMLGLHDEALVQYDELDALFTQYVLNYNVSDSPKWLSLFQRPLDNWNGVNLKNNVNIKLRILLAECKSSILDFRSYLFSRQCAMLIALKKPWEIAKRCLSFVNDTVNELRILEIHRPDGAIECWTFLCALEVLNVCEVLRLAIDNNQLLDLCALHTASLWAIAREKLESLGKLCGLMPGSNPTSEQLHTVVYLISGMGDPEIIERGSAPKKPQPIDKLKEALSSKEAFRKQYLEHTELAMGTYKHVFRNRSARLIGKELAWFYGEMNENHKAVVFLLDALKTYTDEGWPELATQTMRELARCYKKMDDVEKYVKMCAAISASDVLHATVRNSYFDEMLGYLRSNSTDSSTVNLVTELGSCFRIAEMKANVSDKVIQDCMVDVEVVMDSMFPREVRCTLASLSVEEFQKPLRRKGSKTLEPVTEILLKSQLNDSKTTNGTSFPYSAFSKLVFKEDKSIDSANVVGKLQKPQIKRSDSVRHRKPSENLREDFTGALILIDFLLVPGRNQFTLSKKVEQPGYYKTGQLSLIVYDKIEFLSPILEPRLCYQVAKTHPRISLKSIRDLLAGLTQSVELVVFSGSAKIPENSCLKIRTSRGLSIAQTKKQLVREAEIPVPACEPFETNTVMLNVFADLPPKKDPASMEHKLTIQCPWQSEESITLHFGTPLMSGMKLHTAKFRKFIQIIVTGLSGQLFQLTEPTLVNNTSADIHFKSLNPTAGQRLIIGNGMSVSFMWEIEVGKDEASTIPIKTDFRVKYIPVDGIEDGSSESQADAVQIDDDPLQLRSLERVEKESNVYWCNFDVSDYATLFTVSSKVEVNGGGTGDFCRAGSMCHLTLTISRVHNSSTSNLNVPQLMYEVLADQAMWAVCGRTAGITSLEVLEKQTVTLDVMPLTSGFLPLPVVRLSRYIPAAMDFKNDPTRKSEVGLSPGPRLEPFSPGQVYNVSKAKQVHVLPAVAVTSETN